MRPESTARFYEMMSISVPDGTPEELIETAEAVAGYITGAGGRILRSSNESPWGRRRLAYPIRHNSADLRDGFYTLYHFEIKPEGIDAIEREIRLNERVIRYLLLVLESEPVFIEEEEEVTSGTDPVTDETVARDETVVVAESPASGKVEVDDETKTVLVDEAGTTETASEEVEVAVVDGDGAVVSDDVEVAMIDADGASEVSEETEVAVVDAAGEVEAVADDTKIAEIDASGEGEAVAEDAEVAVAEEK